MLAKFFSPFLKLKGPLSPVFLKRFLSIKVKHQLVIPIKLKPKDAHQVKIKVLHMPVVLNSVGLYFAGQVIVNT